ncbi:MAG: SAM-dependent methyltransferase [Polyangiaceae bacterium]
MSDGPRTSEGQRVPGPLGLLHPLRTGDELVPGATVQRAWVWHGRFIFVVGDRRLIVEPPRPDGRYYVRTAKYGIYAEGRVDPEAERIASGLAACIEANEDHHDPMRAGLRGSEGGPSPSHDEPTVFLVPGHLGEPLDVTLRALHALASAGLILVEPGKEETTEALLAEHGISAAPIAGLDRKGAQRVRACIDAGRDVAIFGANEGIPGFCDPGKETLIGVEAPIRTIGGASVLGMALMRAPVDLDRFTFLGTVHDERGAADAVDRWATGDLPAVLFSWGQSLPGLLDRLEGCARRPVTVHFLIALTHSGERVISGTIDGLRDASLGDREPVVVVLEGSPTVEPERWWPRLRTTAMRQRARVRRLLRQLRSD